MVPFSDNRVLLASRCTCNSYNMATRVLADLSHKGALRLRAINEPSA